jgi:hypothetical protein
MASAKVGSPNKTSCQACPLQVRADLSGLTEEELDQLERIRGPLKGRLDVWRLPLQRFFASGKET